MVPTPALPLASENFREGVVLGERTFFIDRPKDPARFIAGEHLPFWAELWPASRMLADAIMREPWMPGTAALEIGCGLGLPGIVALSVGLHVTFSDYDPQALEFAAANARMNGFNDFQTLLLDWVHAPKGLQVPVLLGSDLVYELASVEPVVSLIKAVLAPGGLCLMANQERLPAKALQEAICDSGMSFTVQTMRMEEAAGRRVKGTLYKITKG